MLVAMVARLNSFQCWLCTRAAAVQTWIPRLPTWLEATQANVDAFLPSSVLPEAATEVQLACIPRCSHWRWCYQVQR